MTDLFTRHIKNTPFLDIELTEVGQIPLHLPPNASRIPFRLEDLKEDGLVKQLRTGGNDRWAEMRRNSGAIYRGNKRFPRMKTINSVQIQQVIRGPAVKWSLRPA